jgi:CBS domain-containing protein
MLVRDALSDLSGARALPVEEDGRPVGVVHRDDVLNALAGEGH